MLRRVTSLDVAASRFASFNLNHVFPQPGIGAQRINHNTITFGPLRMIGTGVVLFEKPDDELLPWAFF